MGADNGEATAAGDRPAAPGPEGERILLVDDEPLMLQYISRILSRGGYRVFMAPDAASAMATIAEEPVDLVILDLWLPDDGFQLLRHLVESGGPPVMVHSAEANKAQQLRALDLGAADFILKPVPIAELMERVRAVLEHGTRRP